jgi:competence protein ComEA
MFRILAAFILAAFAFAAQAAVDANKASQAELETVKGIGPGLSSKILDARKAGAFRDWNDLVERVGGVGPSNAARFSQAGLKQRHLQHHGRRRARQGCRTAQDGEAGRRRAGPRAPLSLPFRRGRWAQAPAATAGQPKKASTSPRRAATSASPSNISSRV